MWNWIQSVRHYENFPVGSFLIRPEFRPVFVALYRFARYADDIADESSLPSRERVLVLKKLDLALQGMATDPPIISALRPHWEKHQLPIEPLRSLLSAFLQDAVQDGLNKSYLTPAHMDRKNILNYCNRSASPIGELILRIFGVCTEKNLLYSNSICIALQQINFIQDLGADWKVGRLYLPVDELQFAGVDCAEVTECVRSGRSSKSLRNFISQQVLDYKKRLLQGAYLINQVPNDLSKELRLILSGALQIVRHLEKNRFDPLLCRPKLGWKDIPGIALSYIRLGY